MVAMKVDANLHGLPHDVADLSDGRFVLELGTQVKGDDERRFSVDFEWADSSSVVVSHISNHN